MNEILMQPVGYVSSPVTSKVDENWGMIISEIILEPSFSGAFLGLESFSHSIIVTYLHEAKYQKEKHLKRRPRNLEAMPLVGIFSQRVKDRPNPIGITAVEIVKVEGDVLEVKGLDAINGTPVIDVKPYYPQFDKVDDSKVPEWVNILMQEYF